MACIAGKTSFATEELAVEALIQNHIRFHHRPGAGPQNVYQCADCGQWHFTSRHPISQHLSDPIVQQRIQSERRAADWERKLR